EVWHKEFEEKYPYTESRKLNELQAQPDSGKYEFTNPVKVDTQQHSANKMREYRVSSEIDVEASTPEEAAWKTAEIQKKPFIDSYAHVFTVTDEEGEQHNIDLDENEFIPVAYRQNVRQQTTKDGFIRPIWRQTFMCICTVVGYELY